MYESSLDTLQAKKYLGQLQKSYYEMSIRWYKGLLVCLVDKNHVYKKPLFFRVSTFVGVSWLDVWDLRLHPKSKTNKQTNLKKERRKGGREEEKQEKNEWSS